MTSITIPDSVKVINDRCFVNCPNLVEVVLPDNLTQLNGKVFDATTNIRFSNNSKFYITSDYVIMDKENTTVVQYIGSNSDTNINIHFNASEIKKSAFSDKTLLRSITFPVESKLKTINDYAFSNCYNLEFIGLPSNIVSIGSNSFSNCYKLQTISLNFCNRIGTSSFINCIKLGEIIFEESSITNIPDSCFYNCTSITTLKLPINLETIGDKSFMLCTSLTSVTFHVNVSSFGDSCFRQCNIKQVHMGICKTFQTLSDNCFRDNSLLETIEYPRDLHTLGAFSLSNTSITSFDIPPSLETISSDTFTNCFSLKSINIPSDSRLSLISVGSFRNCINIENIVCESDSYRVVTGALFNSEMTSLILFPPASKVKFFSLPGSTKTIGEGAFMSCVNLLIVMIPSGSVSTILQSAFEGCSNLKMINIPSSVIEVGDDAFKSCDHLSCECEIENRSKIFLNQLINHCKLPKRCIYDCESLYSCRIEFSIHTNLLIHPFIVLLLYKYPFIKYNRFKKN